MALQSVSDVLDDPDFWSEAVLIQSIVAVSSIGLARALERGTRIRGVIFPGNGKGLVQVGDGDFVEGDLAVITRFPIDTGTREVAADAIVFAGLPYTISNAQLWPFGEGFTQAVCKLAVVNPAQTGARSDAGFLG